MGTSILIPDLTNHAAVTGAADELTRYRAAVEREGEQFATTVANGDLDAPIAACPGWDLRELTRHVGLVHLWAAANIAFPSQHWLTVNGLSDVAPYWPEHTRAWPDDDGLVDWYWATLQNLLDVFDRTPVDHECLTFLPAASPLVMWARRQASEIAVHRYDATAANGTRGHFGAKFALDMLDELLVGFAPMMRVSRRSSTAKLLVAPDGVEGGFLVTIGPERVLTERANLDVEADLRVAGSADDVYILMWNRPAGPSVRLDGDDSVLDVWQANCRVQWR